jgi:hypothetical protein
VDLVERVSGALNKIKNIQVEKVVTLFIQVILLQFLLMIEIIVVILEGGPAGGTDIVVVAMGLDMVVGMVVVMEAATIVIETIDDVVVAVVQEVLGDTEMIDMGRKVGIEGGKLKTSLVVYE